MKKTLTSWQIYAGAAAFLVLMAAMFYQREIESPGFLHEAFFKDAGRIFKEIEGHGHSWEYYLDNLIKTRFSFWFIPFILALSLFIFKRIGPYELIFRGFLLFTLSYLIVISFSVTKLLWYDMPLYPCLAVLTAIGFGRIFDETIPTSTFNRSAAVFFLLIFIYPTFLMFRNAQANIIPEGEKKNEAVERFIFAANADEIDLNGVKVFYNGWNGSLLFYKYKLAGEGQNISLTSKAEFQLSDRVLYTGDSLQIELNKRYTYDVIRKAEDAVLIKINGVIQQ